MMKTTSIFVMCLALAVPTASFAQGTIPGAERGAAQGGRAAGVPGAAVGGAVGAATGTLGVGPGRGAGRGGCSSTTVHSEDAAGSETRSRTDC